jgi:hypothetical protein
MCQVRIAFASCKWPMRLEMRASENTPCRSTVSEWCTLAAVFCHLVRW